MNRGRTQGGYTIVELLIFLAVSAVMFVSCMALLGGRQGRTEFQQSIGNFTSELQDIANDVSTGYYTPNLQDGRSLSCVAFAPGALDFDSAGADTQGTNSTCIFIGKAIKFNAPGSGNYAVLTLAGKRTVESTGKNVEDLSQSGIKAITKDTVSDNGDDVEAAIIKNINGGAEAQCVMYSTNALAAAPSATNPPCAAGEYVKVDALSFITTFVATTTGTRNVDLYVASSSSNLTQSLLSTATTIDGLGVTSNRVINPPSGVYICFNSTASNQYGLIKIGGSGSAMSATSTIATGKCT